MKRGRDDGASSLAYGKRAPGARPVSGPNSQARLTTTDALSYLREVKTRFADNKGVYDTFLEIMKEFKAQRLDTSGVIARVKQIFKGHRELVLGFNTFLPKGYEIELARISDDEEQVVEKQPVEFDQAITYVNKIKVRFVSDERMYKAFLEILNMYRKGQKTISNVYEEVAGLFRQHKDLLDEFRYFLPDNSQQMGRSRGRPGAGFSDATAEVKSSHKRKAARYAEENLRAGYGTGSLDRDEEPAARPGLAKELQFFERIKQRLRSRDAYSDLLKCLDLYSQEIVSRHELMFLVSDIIGKYPDLMTGFVEFMGKVEIMDFDLISGAKPGGQIGMQRESMRQKQLQKDKYMTKPLSEIVAHEQERVTPSYVRIPPGYPKLATSGRTKLGHEVLNESHVNVITGSEDYSFKLMRKNQYEEALFRCEDDRYEFEMCIETNTAGLKVLRPIVELANRMSQEERSTYQLERGHVLYGPVPANAIERLYADSGPHVVEYLRRHPAIVAPILVARMEAKDAEWIKLYACRMLHCHISHQCLRILGRRKIREDMTKTWRKIYELNYYKSLDHRSFYFKQAEKKSLLPKAMVAEVREAAEQRKEVQPRASLESTFRSMLCQTRRYEPSACDTQDLVYDYSDQAVFADCWSVMRPAILESSGSGSREQVAGLYLLALEPFFGLPVRQEDLDKLKAELKERRAAKLQEEGAEDSENGSSGNDEDGKEGSEAPADPGAEAYDMDIDSCPKKKSGFRGAALKREDSVSDAEDEATVEEEPMLSSCKPLIPFFSDDCTTAQGEASECTTSQLLLGNEMIYVLFRFHRHLYERMRTARRCSWQQAQQQRGGSRQVGARVEDGAKQTPEELQVEVQLREQADKVHSSFMTMTEQLLTGELETILYEDQVRALLGTNSYELFTIDKLLHKLVNHMDLLLQDDQSVKLLKLHEYERSRSKASNVTYHVNSQSLISDTVFRIEYKNSKSELSIQMLESDRRDTPHTRPPAPIQGPAVEYISNLTSEQAVTISKPGKYTMLMRNLTAAQREDDGELLMNVLKEVTISNGLECKVVPATSKVSYVLDTEDVLYRAGRVMKKCSEARRRMRGERFEKWMERETARLKAEEDTAAALTGSMGEQ